jgi:hypothetical protein
MLMLEHMMVYRCGMDRMNMRHHRSRKSMIHKIGGRMNNRWCNISSKKHSFYLPSIHIVFTLTAYEERSTLVLMKIPIFRG